MQADGSGLGVADTGQGEPGDDAQGAPAGRPTGHRRAAVSAPRHRRAPWLLMVAGLVLVTAVGAWQLYAVVWTTHARDAGRALVRHFVHDHALSAPIHSTDRSRLHASASLPACGATDRTAVHGLLEIPSLGVVAPVEQGSSEAVLAAAVGHDPYSPWPGKTGNAVLLAHDVSYFSAIDKLRGGDRIRYVTPCTTYVFRVASHAIVTAGSPLYETPTPTVTLVTCWPTDALWFTPDRYLVTATEMASEPTGTSAHRYHTVASPPTVPVPSPLVSQGITLSTYSLPMGTLTLSGSPTPAWAQTTSPLLVEGTAVEAFIAGVRAASEDHLGWWSTIAPGVSPPGPLVGAANPLYDSATDVTEHAVGTTVTAVTLTSTVTVSGGARPGRYVMTVRTAIHGRTMTIASWEMAPS